jgi:putative ABC transport system substrate-binding protein
MRRREFIAGLGGAAVWPAVTNAQRMDRMRRVGILLNPAEDDPEVQVWLTEFKHELARLGWMINRNLRIDARFGNATAARFPILAKELVSLGPDVLLAQAPPATRTLQRESRTIPIVFVAVSDPIGSGFVASLPRPGGNITGLLTYEPGIVGKWLGMLKELAPSVVRVALLANPKTTNFEYFLRAAEVAAATLKIEIVPLQIEEEEEIRQSLLTFAGASPSGGLLLPPDGTVLRHRDLIIALAAQHRLPAVYPFRLFALAGGLMSYGTDQLAMFRQAATYVDRILRGTKAADLPVEAPTKYQTVVNLKTAKNLDLNIPSSLLVRADEVIE